MSSRIIRLHVKRMLTELVGGCSQYIDTARKKHIRLLTSFFLRFLTGSGVSSSGEATPPAPRFLALIALAFGQGGFVDFIFDQRDSGTRVNS